MPTEQETISAPSEHEPRDPQSLRGKRIVLCEDEGLTLMQFTRIMMRAGLPVVGTATNGQEAVEVVLNARPDIVLMDVGLPVNG